MEYTPIGNMRHGPFRHHRIIASLVPWDHLVQNTTIGWYAGYHTTSTPYYTVNSSNLITRHIVQGTIIGYLLGAIHVYWIIWWAPAPWPLDTQLSHSLIGWCIKRHQAYQIMFGKKKHTRSYDKLKYHDQVKTKQCPVPPDDPPSRSHSSDAYF